MKHPHQPVSVDRRSFLNSVATTTTAALAGSSLAAIATPALAAAKKQPFKLNYILAATMYGTTKLAEVMPEVKKTSTEFLDIWPRRHADHREQVEALGHDKFKQLLGASGVKLGMTTRYDLGPRRLGDEIKFVHKFGGRLIVCGSGKGKGDSLKAKMKWFVESMKPHVAVAEEHQVAIGIENHGNSLLDSPDSLRYLADFSDSKYLGIAMAPYHLPQDPKLLANLIEHMGPKLLHFYAWEHGMGCHKKLPKAQELLQMPGRGDLDFGPIVAAMKKIDYAHWTEIFMHPTPRGIPILESTAAVTEEINRARGYLTKVTPA